MKLNAEKKIESRRRQWPMLRVMLVLVLLVMIGILSSGCATSAGSETVRQIGNELNEVLPTVSEDDTEQTIAENATFREVFFAVFPELRP